MQNYRDLELPALLDMLSLHTARYTKMLSDRVPKDESETCRKMIQELQTEIESRRREGGVDVKE